MVSQTAGSQWHATSFVKYVNVFVKQSSHCVLTSKHRFPSSKKSLDIDVLSTLNGDATVQTRRLGGCVYLTSCSVSCAANMTSQGTLVPRINYTTTWVMRKHAVCVPRLSPPPSKMALLYIHRGLYRGDTRDSHFDNPFDVPFSVLVFAAAPRVKWANLWVLLRKRSSVRIVVSWGGVDLCFIVASLGGSLALVGCIVRGAFFGQAPITFLPN